MTSRTASSCTLIIKSKISVVKLSSSLLRSSSTPSFALSASVRTRWFSQTLARTSHIGSKPIAVPPDVSISFCHPIRPRTHLSTTPKSDPQVTVSGRLGKLSIDILSCVTLSFEGPATKRVLGRDLPPTLLISPAQYAAETLPEVPKDTVTGAGILKVTVEDPTVKRQKGVWGLTRALLANAVEGVTQGFTSSLELVGVGYRASLEPIPPNPGETPDQASNRQRLNLRVGYSHPVLINLPDTDTFLNCQVPSPNQILLKGIDKQELGLLGAGIRKWRPPEPYNGKGIYLNNEIIKRKESKKK
ncbi:hypothetical protein O181_038561 [Austropuccinia psidii MF-1]|uniref:Large ribosomal subunit protein uL6 alpha-beta domain-containing protein n=1 Tax=Austropuccinia psidii MF-1 TaxID=1389203 RepID=A0A9Q3DE79_9BASI|nr:hypothetical protein [Austropuccinia psidii MF-1]